MKYIVSILFLFTIVIVSAQETMTPLKKAFQKAREQNNIDLVLPVLLNAELYVVVGEIEPGKFDYFYTKSRKPGRLCVTVSENKETLDSIKWPKRKIIGRKLIEEIPVGIEIIILYGDGGDSISREHLKWYRQQLP